MMFGRTPLRAECRPDGENHYDAGHLFWSWVALEIRNAAVALIVPPLPGGMDRVPVSTTRGRPAAGLPPRPFRHVVRPIHIWHINIPIIFRHTRRNLIEEVTLLS